MQTSLNCLSSSSVLPLSAVCDMLQEIIWNEYQDSRENSDTQSDPEPFMYTELQCENSNGVIDMR